MTWCDTCDICVHCALLIPHSDDVVFYLWWSDDIPDIYFIPRYFLFWYYCIYWYRYRVVLTHFWYIFYPAWLMYVMIFWYSEVVLYSVLYSYMTFSNCIHYLIVLLLVLRCDIIRYWPYISLMILLYIHSVILFIVVDTMLILVLTSILLPLNSFYFITFIEAILYILCWYWSHIPRVHRYLTLLHLLTTDTHFWPSFWWWLSILLIPVVIPELRCDGNLPLRTYRI